MASRNKTEPSIFTNYQELFKKIISFRYVFIVSMVIVFAIAYLYNTYTTSRFEVFSKIRPIRGEGASIVSNDLFRGLQAFSANNEIEDEINNLRSYSTVLSTINQLNFEVAYYQETGRFFKKTTELYTESPFLVTFDKSHNQPINTRFFIYQLSDSTFHLSASEKEAYLYKFVERQVTGKVNSFSVDTILNFNEPFRNSYLNFTISKRPGFYNLNLKSTTRNYFVFFNDEILARSYLGGLSVSRITQPSSILTVTFRGQNLGKTIDFLNNFLAIYFENNLSKKNAVANHTINFIDSQISEVSDSLNISGTMLREFRSRNQVTDLGFQGQMILGQLQQVDEEIIRLRRHERYYNFLLEYLREHETDYSGIVLPSAMNVEDPLITQQIGALISLSSERANILSTKGENNPFLTEVDGQIRVQKQGIIESVRNNLNTMSSTINDLSYRAQRHSGQISNLPRTELNMISMQRRFDLNDELYTFLLQKRSEAAISLASNQPDYEVLEPARAITSGQVAPRTTLNYMIAFVLGLLFPTMGLIGRSLFNQRIQSTQYIEQLTNRTVLGIIFSNHKKNEKIVETNFFHPTSESFRGLKTSLIIKNQNKGPNVVIVTSPQPEDGKSFVSYNLAVTMALAGHKTVLIDADLRKPRLHKIFYNENKFGLSTLLVNNTPINTITFQTTVENLKFIPTGPLLQAPSRIIEAGVIDALIQSLKQEFGYIIVDTTPVGMISDAFPLLKNATNILLVSRNNHTRKEIFVDVLDKFESNRILNYDVVFNEVDFKDSPYKVYKKYYRGK